MNKTVTIRLNDEELKIFERCKDMYDGSLSSIIKRLALEKLDDEYDLKAITEYEFEKKNDSLVVKDIENLFDEYGIEYEKI